MTNDHNENHPDFDSQPTSDDASSFGVHESGFQDQRMAMDSGPISVHPTSLDQEIDSQATTSPGTELPIEFRVVRPGAPVRRLRLTGNRYTFGGGDGCSIQLDDDTLRPMHAVLLKDAHRILMRAYSIPLEHNGTRVAESTLRVGDIIRMGNYRFELVSAPGIATADPRAVAMGPVPVLEDPQAQLKTKLADLSQQWHVRHAECDARESRCDQRETDLHTRESELWSRASNLQQREQLLQDQEDAAVEIQEAYSATQEELRELRDRESTDSAVLQHREDILSQRNEELRARTEELRRRQSEWEQKEEEFAQQAEDASHLIEQTQTQAQSASDAVQRMREEFVTLNDQLEDLRLRHNELQEREKRTQSEHERLRDELEAARDSAIDAKAESEAKRTETETELTEVSQALAEIREEIESVREESRVTQAELNERLVESSHELQEARQQAEQARQQADAAKLEVGQTQLSSQQVDGQSRQTIDELSMELKASRQEFLKQQQDHTREQEESRSLAKQELDSLQEELAEANVQLTDAQEQLADAKEQLSETQQDRSEAESETEELRKQIEELQETVASANEEASSLRVECDGAKASIRQLELLVDQTKTNQSSQQDSWVHESEQLRQTVEELSVQLAQANSELESLRATNKALWEELNEVNSNQGEEEVGGQADGNQFGLLQSELDAARSEIQRLQVSHDEALAKIESERIDNEATLRDEIVRLQREVSSSVTPSSHLQQTSQESNAQFEVDSEAHASELSDSHAWYDENEDASVQAEAGIDQVEMDGEFSAEEAGLESCEDGGVSAQGQDSETQSVDSAATEVDAHTSDVQRTSEIVEHGDSVWRVEGEQASAVEGPVSEWIDPDDILEDTSKESGWANAQDAAGSGPLAGSGAQHTDENSDSEGSVRWSTEPLEQAVNDVIEDIEHNVEQAISDFPESGSGAWVEGEYASPALDENEEESDDLVDVDLAHSVALDVAEDSERGDAIPTAEHELLSPQEESSVEEGSLTQELHQETVSTEDPQDDETGLHWSAYMPGGYPNAGEEPHGPDASAHQEDGSFREDESFDEVAPENMTAQWPGAVGVQDNVEEDSSADLGSDSVSSMAYIDPAMGHSESELNVSDAAMDDEPSEMSESQTAGALADMLIRDLGTSTPSDEMGKQPVDPTFVMEEPSPHMDQDQDEASSDWSHEPSGYSDDSQEADDSQAEPLDEGSPITVSETATADENATVSAPEHVPQDDSIESYMSRLLQRVQNTDEPTDEPDVSTSVPSPSVGSESMASSIPASVEHDSESASETLHDDSPMVPRSHAPERDRNMNAMRDLANQSARNAVARSIRVQARDTQMKAALKAAVAAAWLVMAIGVFLFVTWSSTIKILMMGAFVTLCAVFAYEGWTLWQEAQRRLGLAEESAQGAKDDEAIAEELAKIADEQ